MHIRRITCVVLVFMLLFGIIPFPSRAAQMMPSSMGNSTTNTIYPRATNSFNISIPAKTKAQASSSFSLVAGETVTIKASYAPFSASVDFGLIAPDGKFYYFNVTNGSIDKTIEVSESGKYTLQIRNKSTSEVKVSGFVNY